MSAASNTDLLQVIYQTISEGTNIGNSMCRQDDKCVCRNFILFPGWNIGSPYCCSCKSDPCFPGAANVILDNEKTIKLSELQIGDRVQTGLTLHLINLFGES